MNDDRYDDVLEVIEELLEDLYDWKGVDKSQVISLFDYNLLVSPDNMTVMASWEDRDGKLTFAIQAIDPDYYADEWIDQRRSNAELPDYNEDDFVMMLIDMWNIGWEIIDWDTNSLEPDEFLKELEKIHEGYIPF